ncbi:uncharacterized protein [Argopecten irradians]|uniref:uncharacterized protein n=1 Tax=Argopecten irradians TaxID=31199 RepID=UPI00371AE232
MASLHDSSFYCITEHELPPAKRLIYTVISVVAASLGIFGASWQIITYCPETQAFLKRTNSTEKPRQHSLQPNPVIVLFLALTNLTSCLGSVLRSVATYIVATPLQSNATVASPSTCPSLSDATFIPQVNTNVKIAGGILEVFTDFSYVASSLWTLSFAINIYSQLVGRHIPMKVFHLWTWLGTSVSVIAGLVSIYMGTDWMSKGMGISYSRPILVQNTGAWNIPRHKTNNLSKNDNNVILHVSSFDIVDAPGQERIFWRYMSTYVPMAFTLIMICVLYWKASISVSLLFTKLTAMVGHEEQAIIQRLRMRFFWIVFFFALCWFPNFVDCFFHIDLLAEKCMYKLDGLLFPLWIIEALVNPLQGLLNCFLYGRKCSCKPFVFNARTRRHYTPIMDTDRSYTGLLNNSTDSPIS